MASDTFKYFIFFAENKLTFHVNCLRSEQMIHLKFQDLFSIKAKNIECHLLHLLGALRIIATSWSYVIIYLTDNILPLGKNN